MKKRYLLTLLIIAGFILSYFYEPSLDTFAHPNKIGNGTALNFYLHDMETRTFNIEGIHTNTLSSIYAVQQVDKKQLTLDQPLMLIALNLTPWVAQAQKGLSSENLKKITLQEKVTLSRTDGTADISTETLVFDSEDEVAYTQSAVEILTHGSQTNTDGFFIDLNKEIISLKKHVKTYYVPETIKPHRVNYKP